MKKNTLYGVICATLWTFASLNTTQAETYRIKPGQDVIGQNLSTVTSSYLDDFTTIARRYNVPYDLLVLANPHLNPHLPGINAEIMIPKLIILPEGKRSDIVINLAEFRLYYFHPDGTTVSVFPIGIGRVGWQTPEKTTTISSKIKDPSWTAPASIIREYAADGVYVPGYTPPGPDNPLGLYAMRMAIGSYLIHGTPEDETRWIGRRSTHGCISLYPEDIITLYQLVKTGTKVHIINEPYKIGRYQNMVYFQGFPQLKDDNTPVTHDKKSLKKRLKAMIDLSHLPQIPALESLLGNPDGITYILNIPKPF